MVIAGGEWQVPIVRKAKGLGLYVINTNLYEDSPGFYYADVGLVADVLDVERNLAFATEYMPDAVVTDQSDIAVPTVARICERLGLKGIGSAVAERFTNKYVMRNICRQAGFPSPDFVLCANADEVTAFLKRRRNPVVIKPPASQSSRGVTRVTAADQVECAFAAARQFSRDGTVLAEDYIDGIELTVDGIKTGREHYCLATSCKTHFKHNAMVASRLWFSQDHPGIDYRELHRQHNELIADMELPFGLTHAEYIYRDGLFYLVEVAARGGGTRLSSDVVPLMSGVDSTELLIRMALGEEIDQISPIRTSRTVVMEFFEFDAGTVRGIRGVEESRRIPGVVQLGLHIAPGDTLHPASDDRTRHGYVIAKANTSFEIETLLHRIRNTITVDYE